MPCTGKDSPSVHEHDGLRRTVLVHLFPTYLRGDGRPGRLHLYLRSHNEAQVRLLQFPDRRHDDLPHRRAVADLGLLSRNEEPQVNDAFQQFLLFVLHSALMNATMNESLECGYQTIHETSVVVYELTYGLGADIRAMESV